MITDQSRMCLGVVLFWKRLPGTPMFFDVFCTKTMIRHSH